MSGVLGVQRRHVRGSFVEIIRRSALKLETEMATAAKVTIAEVEELVETGDLNPDAVHTPSVYVPRIVHGEFYEKPIERRTVIRAAT